MSQQRRDKRKPGREPEPVKRRLKGTAAEHKHTGTKHNKQSNYHTNKAQNERAPHGGNYTEPKGLGGESGPGGGRLNARDGGKGAGEEVVEKVGDDIAAGDMAQQCKKAGASKAQATQTQVQAFRKTSSTSEMRRFDSKRENEK